ncbi:MAG: hypothetical protein L0I29_11030 [Hyphomicrobiales bacterium]|nr:hypothetical protein [Hyphomicrobiales bacterium]
MSDGATPMRPDGSPDETPHIVFLDDDIVVRLARFAMAGSTAVPEDWVQDYFRPEIADLAVIRAMAHGLRVEDGASVFLAPQDSEERLELLRLASIVVFRRGEVDAALLGQCPRLKLVQRLGERSDMIDLTAAAHHGVQVSCIPRRTLRYTAEHALLLMLALSKRLVAADRSVRQGCFDRAMLRPMDAVSYNWSGLAGVTGLHGATLGIVGLGEVGTMVLRLAQAFGMRVIYTSRNQLPPSRERDLHTSFSSMDHLLRESDFISIHATDRPETRGLIGAAQLARMKPTASLINTSRGRLIDEDALHDALIAGRIAGAGLDVHATEPREGGDRFAALANVVLTPHVGGGSRLGVLDEVAHIFENGRAALRGDQVAFRPPA